MNCDNVDDDDDVKTNKLNNTNCPQHTINENLEKAHAWAALSRPKSSAQPFSKPTEKKRAETRECPAQRAAFDQATQQGIRINKAKWLA